MLLMTGRCLYSPYVLKNKARKSEISGLINRYEKFDIKCYRSECALNVGIYISQSISFITIVFDCLSTLAENIFAQIVMRGLQTINVFRCSILVPCLQP